MGKKQNGLSTVGILSVIMLIILSTTITRWLVMETNDNKIRELESRIHALQEYSRQLEGQLKEIRQQMKTVNLQLGMSDYRDEARSQVESINSRELANGH